MATKTAKAKADRLARGKARQRHQFNPEHLIFVLAKDNPKRPKTKEWQRFAKYKNKMTVAAARALGMDSTNFQRDVRLGYIKIGKA